MNSSASWKSLEPKASTDADQFEFAAMRGVSATIDTAIYDNIVSGAIDDEMDEFQESLSGPHWQMQDLAEEGLLDSTRAEIERRIRLMGAGYPFKFEGNKLVYVASKSGFYEFCLAITQSPSITEGNYVKFPRLFERAVAHLLKLYFGKYSTALHTGHPRSPSTSFREVMCKLSRPPFEWVWGPQDQLVAEDIKDETLDFVVTIHSLDERSGNLYVLGQCACGNNWGSKLRDPDVNKIQRWFHPGWALTPVRAFTTPFVIGDSTMRSVVTESDALVFDRPRLVKIAEESMAPAAQRGMKRRVEPVSLLVS